ncbi:hypothetical protein [Roseovarius nitratireducens]|uniref:hypothetical protein n=1 Tax=Roseovarius nitratireducens TaxID=2044597 RepID=UPI00101ADA72|nr:hypothetical protein [Roseovarius nitratireducens]
MARARIAETDARNEANLRRATSDLYYAMFHAVCEALVEPLGAIPDSEAFIETYTNLYRQLDHGYAEKRCRAVTQDKHFSLEIVRFSKLFITLKNKREKADYHPLEMFKFSVVKNDLETTETQLRAFWEAGSSERASFSCFVGLRFRRE